MTALPASGTLYQCQLATFAASVADSLNTLCLPSSAIAVGEQVPLIGGLFRVVYLPPSGGSAATLT